MGFVFEKLKEEGLYENNLADKVVWDGKLMAIAVNLDDEFAEGKGLRCANGVPHITVGTKSQIIKPRESNDLLVTWKAGKDGKGEKIHVADLGGV
ncbi:fungal tRNA ligase phosphodiesterase domain-containing protein [Tirmania nivea]|nr:fungal tRNA ligase phosphodiesterase domain-containing protein [Tirmania nivea]